MYLNTPMQNTPSIPCYHISLYCIRWRYMPTGAPFYLFYTHVSPSLPGLPIHRIHPTLYPLQPYTPPPPIYPMPSFLLAQPCSPHYVPITQVTLSYHYSHLIHLSFSFKVAQLYTFKPRQISSNSVAQPNINTFPDLILPRVFLSSQFPPFWWHADICSYIKMTVDTSIWKRLIKFNDSVDTRWITR